MQNLFSYRFSTNIWRVIPDADEDSGQWAIELRDATEKNVHFAIIDIEKQQLIWEKRLEGADWWSSLTAFAFGRIYLHQYRNPELPEPTDLLCYAARSGELEWALPRQVLVRIIDRDMLEVAAKTGDGFTRSACRVDDARLLPLPAETGVDIPQIILAEPVRYKVGNPYFDQLAAFIERMTGHAAAVVDYLEKRPFIVFSYYIYEQDKSIQYLLIVNSRQEVMLHEKLSEGREGVGRSTMMLRGLNLVFLKNNNEFSSLTLPE